MRAGPRLWCTVTSAVLRTEPIRSDASRLSSWCARTMRARGTSASGRRWRRNIWQPTTAWKCRAETLRRWMLAAGLWSRRRKRQPHRTRRQRKAHFGELIQLDGSHHHWLEERGPKACLMNFVDDANRCGAVPFLGPGNDLGRGRSARSLGASTRRSQGVVLRLEKRLPAPADVAGSAGRHQARDAVRAHVCQARHYDHGGFLAASQGPSGAPSRHAPRPPDQEDAAARGSSSTRRRTVISTRSTWPSTTSASPVSRRRQRTFTRQPPPRHRAARRVLLRVRTRGEQRPGGAFRESLFAVEAETQPGRGGGARVTVQQWRDESLQVRFDGHGDRARRDRHGRRHSCGRSQHHSSVRGAGASRRRTPLAASCVTEKTGCEYIRGLWKCRVGWKAWKISRGSSTGFEARWMVFHPSHRPLEIATRFHSSTAPTTTISLLRTRNTRGHFYQLPRGTFLLALTLLPPRLDFPADGMRSLLFLSSEAVYTRMDAPVLWPKVESFT